MNWRKPCYVVRGDGGHAGLWTRRWFREAMTGEIDGEPFEVRPQGRRRFAIVSHGTELARAEATRRGGWSILVQGATYELQRRAIWRSAMELRCNGVTIGSIHKGRAPRGLIICELPGELSPPVQAFIGFVVLLVGNRAASSSGAAAVAASG